MVSSRVTRSSGVASSRCRRNASRTWCEICILRRAAWSAAAARGNQRAPSPRGSSRSICLRSGSNCCRDAYSGRVLRKLSMNSWPSDGCEQSSRAPPEEAAEASGPKSKPPSMPWPSIASASSVINVAGSKDSPLSAR
eukprot:scaffold112649_cov72-Phaeocystis_antarctica.AAC.5